MFYALINFVFALNSFKFRFNISLKYNHPKALLIYFTISFIKFPRSVYFHFSLIRGFGVLGPSASHLLADEARHAKRRRPPPLRGLRQRHELALP